MADVYGNYGKTELLIYKTMQISRQAYHINNVTIAAGIDSKNRNFNYDFTFQIF